MTFASFKFILVFLPVILFLYDIAGRKKKEYAEYVLIIFSLYFYSCFGKDFLLLFLVQTAVNYIFCRLLQKNKSRGVYAAALICNILILLYFRYTDFFITCMNQLRHGSQPLLNLAVPVGISYYTFQVIALFSDIRNGAVTEMTVTDYILYMLYFPKLIQGPILQYESFMKPVVQARQLSVKAENLAYGIQRFARGLAKKILIADTLGNAVAYTYAGISLAGGINIILTGIFYTMQLYLDFSGYSDMACGISMMFGIKLPENFRSPYRALSIGDFWKRWHISLTDFLRKYIYFPLGGSRKGTVRTYINVMIIFLISGFWHGANWTYLLWGLFHGILSCIDRRFGKTFSRLPAWLRWCVTFSLVTVLWLLFRSESIGQFAQMMQRLLDVNNMHLTEKLYSAFDNNIIKLLNRYTAIPYWMQQFACMILYTAASFAVCFTEQDGESYQPEYTWRAAFVTVFLLIASMLSFTGVVTFFYQRF